MPAKLLSKLQAELSYQEAQADNPDWAVVR